MCDFLSTLEASVPSTNPHEYFLRFPTLTAPTHTIVYHTTAPHRPYAQLLTCVMAFKPITISHVFCAVVVVPWCLSAVSKQTTPTDIACRDGTYVDLPQKACSVAPRNETLEHPNHLSAPPLAYPVPYDGSHADASLYSSHCRQHSVLCSTTRQRVLSIMTVLLSSTTTTGRRALLAIVLTTGKLQAYIDLLLSSSAGSVGNYLASQSSHLNNAFFYCFHASLPFSSCFRRATFSFFLPLWASLSTMYAHVVEHPMLYCSTASTAQSSRTKPQSKYAPIRTRQRKQANKRASTYCIALPQAQHSTARQPAQSRNASTCRSECDDASKQTALT